MPTLNVCIEINMNKKNTKFIKITNISLLFRSFVSVFITTMLMRELCTLSMCLLLLLLLLLLEAL